MKFKTILIALLVFILFDLAVFWVVTNWSNLRAFPYIISSFYSKEFCSCYFLVRQDEAFCHNYARQWVPISSFQLNKKTQSVTVSGLGKTNTARFLNEKYGCVLEKME